MSRMYTFKILVAAAIVASGLFIGAEGANEGQARESKSLAIFDPKYDLVEDSIREIDSYLQSSEDSSDNNDLLQEIRNRMQYWDGSELCAPEEARQIAGWAKALHKAQPPAPGAISYELAQGWLLNRVAQCTDKFVEKYKEQLKSIESAIRLGRMNRNSYSSDSFWYRYFRSYTRGSDERHLSNYWLIKVGLKARAWKVFERLYEENISKPCKVGESMEDAKGFAKAVDGVASLMASKYRHRIRDFYAIWLGCETATFESKQSIFKDTWKGYESNAKMLKYLARDDVYSCLPSF